MIRFSGNAGSGFRPWSGILRGARCRTFGILRRLVHLPAAAHASPRSPPKLRDTRIPGSGSLTGRVRRALPWTPPQIYPALPPGTPPDLGYGATRGTSRRSPVPVTRAEAARHPSAPGPAHRSFELRALVCPSLPCPRATRTLLPVTRVVWGWPSGMRMNHRGDGPTLPTLGARARAFWMVQTTCYRAYIPADPTPPLKGGSITGGHHCDLVQPLSSHA